MLSPNGFWPFMPKPFKTTSTTFVVRRKPSSKRFYTYFTVLQRTIRSGVMDHKVKQYIYGPTLSQIPINEQAQILLRFSNIFQSETDSRSRICSFYNVLSKNEEQKNLVFQTLRVGILRNSEYKVEPDLIQHQVCLHISLGASLGSGFRSIDQGQHRKI